MWNVLTFDARNLIIDPEVFILKKVDVFLKIYYIIKGFLLVEKVCRLFLLPLAGGDRRVFGNL